MTNLNYYWQKRNEQEQKSRDREKLNEDFEAGLAKRANDEKIKKLEAELANAKKQPKKVVRSETDEYYRNLLSKPMLEIAMVNGDFRGTYEKQQELLGEWMVSQKAFKEVAIKLGLEAGKTREEVTAAAKVEVDNVLNNQTQHGNNLAKSDDDDWALFYAPRIKQRFKEKRSKK